MFQIEVKLYTYHDLDLVSIYQSGQIDFPSATRQVLDAYAGKKVFRIQLYDANQKREERYAGKPTKKYYHYYVDFSEEDDAGAISLLNGIAPGYRNNFIKSLLRQYLCGVFTAAYSADGDTSLFDEMSDLFQAGREEKMIPKDSDRIPRIGEESRSFTEEAADPPVHRAKRKAEQMPEKMPEPEPEFEPEPAETDAFEEFFKYAAEQY